MTYSEIVELVNRTPNSHIVNNDGVLNNQKFSVFYMDAENPSVDNTFVCVGAGAYYDLNELVRNVIGFKKCPACQTEVKLLVDSYSVYTVDKNGNYYKDGTLEFDDSKYWCDTCDIEVEESELL